ncbi:MAG: nitrate reductase cytochrome c-type subunit [Plesiomonas sp.]|uniref:nitrate reductase cytochrome c-type subunit n=1 Tax=Plesiomonas sp. TaxID=2486279 RepID=UPI003F29F734
MKKLLSLCFMLTALALGAHAATTDSIKNNYNVDFAKSSEAAQPVEKIATQPKEQQRLPLDYVNQPPLIPHDIKGYQVSMNNNQCLQCHGVEKYRISGAPRISPTHFMDRDGKVLNQVAPRRYFCLQCHVPQTDATPIIDNTFKPTTGFGQ